MKVLLFVLLLSSVFQTFGQNQRKDNYSFETTFYTVVQKDYQGAGSLICEEKKKISTNNAGRSYHYLISAVVQAILEPVNLMSSSNYKEYLFDNGKAYNVSSLDSRVKVSNFLTLPLAQNYNTKTFIPSNNNSLSAGSGRVLGFYNERNSYDQMTSDEDTYNSRTSEINNLCDKTLGRMRRENPKGYNRLNPLCGGIVIDWASVTNSLSGEPAWALIKAYTAAHLILKSISHLHGGKIFSFIKFINLPPGRLIEYKSILNWDLGSFTSFPFHLSNFDSYSDGRIKLNEFEEELVKSRVLIPSSENCSFDREESAVRFYKFKY